MPGWLIPALVLALVVAGVAFVLSRRSHALTENPMVVVATKLDATTDPRKLEKLRKFSAQHDLEFHSISAATGEGVKELVRGMADALDRVPKEGMLAEPEAPESAEIREVGDSHGAELLDDSEQGK